jgi:cytochrome c-type biogenesis protein CcmH
VNGRRRTHGPALLLVLAALAALIAAPVAAAAARASLTEIENDVMCVSCHEPLAVAQSPQAYAERDFVRSLIAQGQSKAQIERQLVAQYGPAVLGRPPAHGFNLTVYVLPPAIVLIGIAVLAFALPRWRRRARGAPVRALATDGPPDAAEQLRLDQELSRYRG